MRHLTNRVYSSIGSTSHSKPYWLVKSTAQHHRHGVLNNRADSAAAGLARPAGETRAVVTNIQPKSDEPASPSGGDGLVRLYYSTQDLSLFSVGSTASAASASSAVSSAETSSATAVSSTTSVASAPSALSTSA